MTDNPIKAQPGDTIHVLAGGLLVFGNVYKRGDEIMLTADLIEGTRDRLGDSWLDDVSENAQTRRWGEPRFGLGSWPVEALPWVPGSRDHAEARELARRAAWRIDDPEQRAQALAQVRSRFGDAPTSQTTNSAPNASIRAEREQRARLDSEGVRVRSVYAPAEREV